MQYIDPYTLFDLDVESPEEIGRSQLRRAKQKVLAEFELSDDIVVRIGDYELDKATALRLLDELEDPTLRRHHFFLHRQPHLQLFLSKDKLRFLRRIPPAEQLGDQDFRKFLSAKLAPVFDRHLSEHLRAQHKPEVSLLLERLDLIDAWDLDTAMRSSLRYLNQNIIAVKDAAEGPDLDKFDAPGLYNRDLIRLMNRLPRVYQHVRNRYGEALKDLAVALHNKQRRTFLAYTVICAAAELEMDLSAREHINFTKVELWRRQREQKQQQQSHASSQWEESYTSWSAPTEEPEAYSSAGQPAGSGNQFGCTIGGVIMFIVLILVITQGKWGNGSGPFSYDNDYTSIKLPDFESINSLSRMLEEQEKKRERAIFIFDSLEASFEMDLPGYGSDRPDVGDEPYRLDLNLFSGLGDGQPLQVVNDSDKDIVFFVVDHEENKLERHAFIPAGGSDLLTLITPGLKKVGLYTGRDWQRGKVSWHGDILPGFSEDVEVIKPGDLEFKGGGVLFDLQQSPEDSYLSGPALEITFDGKQLKTTG